VKGSISCEMRAEFRVCEQGEPEGMPKTEADRAGGSTTRLLTLQERIPGYLNPVKDGRKTGKTNLSQPHERISMQATKMQECVVRPAGSGATGKSRVNRAARCPAHRQVIAISGKPSASRPLSWIG
jgi:hypothetical protein